MIRETSLEVSLLGSRSHPGSIEQPSEPFHYFSSLNLSAESPSQDDIPSPTITISEVLIDLAANVPSPSSSPKKVHFGSNDRVNVERAITTTGTSIDQEDSDNITKSPTTTTHSEDVSLETLFTERNPRCQENQGDGDAEARPKAPSSSKDSTTVNEDRLKLQNMELTARVAMLESEVSKLQHQVSMYEAHQCPPVTTPSLVSVGTQTDETLCNDATKKGKIVTAENNADSLDEWIQEQAAFQKFDSILAWGYDGLSERFWIGREFGGTEELNWNTLNPLQVLELYLSSCINTSTNLLAELAINRFYVLMEVNLPWFEWFLEEANRVAYPKHIAKSSTTSEQRMPPRFDLIRSSALTEEQVLCWRRFFYNETVRGLESQEKWLLRMSKRPSKLYMGLNGKRKRLKQSLPAVSVPHLANEAEAEIPTSSLTSVVVIHEAEAEASNKDKGKGIMTEEEEERIKKEKREKEKRRREREEEEMVEIRKIQERKGAILLREQQIQLHARQLDALKVNVLVATQLQEDESLALQLQEQLNKEEEEREKKRRG
ncbi:hypothetical protein L1987_83246 [Smallanthus sonchifolius]|uniref:Uncharacterized protein n=1 Tax=Smallanthus sonchifolius TaxID=185202 RepID=A0ACB8YD92_9ASTR|nr:hypothetical protein L1987_83246 [Smallanthus sonchifolius]